MASTSAVATSDGSIEYVEKKNDSTVPKIRINFNNEGKSVVVPVTPNVTVNELVDLIKAKFERLHGTKIQVNSLNNIINTIIFPSKLNLSITLNSSHFGESLEIN